MDGLHRPARDRWHRTSVLALTLVVGGLLFAPPSTGPRVPAAMGPPSVARIAMGLHPLPDSNASQPWTLGVNGSAVTFDPRSENFFVSDPGNGTVLIVNGSTRHLAGRPLPVPGAGPSAFDSDNGYVYVVSAGPGGWGGVTVLNGTTGAIVPSNIIVGGSPSAVAFDARDNLLFVANSGTQNISVVNGVDQRVQGNSIFLGDARSPATLAFDQRTGVLYVGIWDTVAPGTYSGGWVGLVNGANATLENLSVGSDLDPTSLAYDPQNQEIYETGYQPTQGEPSPIAAINGTTENTTTLPNEGPGLNGGSIVVAGDLGLVYFGSDDGPPRVFDTSTTTFVSAPLPAPGEPAAFDPTSGWLLLVAPGTELSVPPGPVEAVDDTALVPASFVETGLPSGTRWQVGLADSTVVNTSTTPTIGFLAWNGSYSYEVSPVPGQSTAYSGTFLVQGPASSMSVPFTPFGFPVTFVELGLAADTNWSASVASGTSSRVNQSTSATSLTVNLPNGTYRVEFSAPGYAAPSGAISVVVNGTSPASQTVQFTSVPGTLAGSARLLELILVVVAGALVVGGIVAFWRARSRRPPTNSYPAA
jgi:hypothetical protein